MPKSHVKGHQILPDDSLGAKSDYLCYANEAITKGQILCVVGRSGKKWKVEKAGALAAADTSGLLLCAQHSAASGRSVRAKVHGAIEAQDTSGLAVGDPVYLSATGGGWATGGSGFRRRVGTVAVVDDTVGVISFNGSSDGGDRLLTGTATVASGQTSVTVTAATLGGIYGGRPVIASAEDSTNHVYFEYYSWSTNDLVLTLSADPGAGGADVNFAIVVS